MISTVPWTIFLPIFPHWFYLKHLLSTSLLIACLITSEFYILEKHSTDLFCISLLILLSWSFIHPLYTTVHCQACPLPWNCSTWVSSSLETLLVSLLHSQACAFTHCFYLLFPMSYQIALFIWQHMGLMMAAFRFRGLKHWNILIFLIVQSQLSSISHSLS